MRILLLIFLFCGMANAQPQKALQIPGTRVYFSPNGQYRLTLEGTAPVIGQSFESLASGQISATLSRVDGNSLTNLWQNNIVSRSVFQINDWDVMIPDDGAFFLVSNLQDRWTLCASNQTPRILQPFSKSELNPLVELDQFSGESVIRRWSSRLEKWEVFSIKTEKKIEITPDLTALWNEAARKKIIASLQRQQNEELRSKLKSVSSKLSEMTKAAIPPAKPNEVRDVHLQFLALLRNPADRVWFENMIKPREPIFAPSRLQRIFISRGGRTIPRTLWPSNFDPYTFESFDIQRIKGDDLLAAFDRKPFKFLSNPPGLRSELRYLGKAFGVVRLPAPILKSSGSIRIYLAPEKVAGKVWSLDTIEQIDFELQLPPQDRVDFSDEIDFAFGNVLPGQYLLKAIWDKRPAFTDTHKAGPGDYESAWMPVAISAGMSVTNLLVLCTNRVAGGETYYAADAIAARQWRESGFISPYGNVDPDGRRALFSTNFARWAIGTNIQATGVLPINRIDLLAPVDVAKGSNTLRPPELVLVSRRRSINGSPGVSPEFLSIIDEHGCDFPSKRTRSNRQINYTAFTEFPRSAATWRIVAYDMKKSVLYDYVITNLVRIPPIAVDPQPLPLKLQLGRIEMTVTNVSKYNFDPFIRASFLENGKPTENWWTTDIQLTDADGNIIDPEDMCRAQTATRVIGHVSAKIPLSKETIPFEFTVPRLKPWIGKSVPKQ